MRRWVCCLFLFGLIALHSSLAGAVLIDHYDNALPPDGLYTLLYGNYYTAGSFTGPSGRKVADADLTAAVGAFRGLDYFHIGKLPLAFQVIVPFGKVEERKVYHQKSTGVGDVIFGPAVFLYDDQKSNTYLSYWLFIGAPTGDWDAKKSVNLGADHWFFEHQLAFHTEFGKVIWDQNLNYYQHAREQDHKVDSPDRFQLETNVGYQITEKFIAGINGGAYWDLSNAKAAGATVADSQAEKVQIGPSFGYQITEKAGVNLRWTHDVVSKNDSKGDDVWLRFCYAF